MLKYKNKIKKFDLLGYFEKERKHAVKKYRKFWGDFILRNTKEKDKKEVKKLLKETPKKVKEEERKEIIEFRKRIKEAELAEKERFKPYSSDWTKTLRISIRERDHYTCQICGKLQGDIAFDVHHLDYDKQNCNPKNLITLCKSCHRKTSHNKRKLSDVSK